MLRKDQRVDRIVTQAQFKCSRISDDVAFLDESRLRGFTGTVPLVPAAIEAQDYIAELAEDRPLALLGFHYVLEGSTNGNHFLAKGLRKALGLEDRGVSYLDPYGKDQRRKWSQFKVDMDAAGFDESEVEIIKASACRAFELIGGIGSGLTDAMG